MKKLLPDFLKRIDHYLLTTHPLVWRTRVHYFLFFGLIGNMLAILLPTLFITVLDTFPLENTFYGFLITGMGLSGFLLLFWGFDQHRFPNRSKSFKEVLTTVSLYAVCVLSVGSIFLTGSYTAVRQIAVKGAPGTAASYQQFLNDNGVISYSYYEKLTSNPLTKEQTIKAREILDFFNVEYSLNVTDDTPNQIVLTDTYLFNRRVDCYRNAQNFYYKGQSKIRTHFYEIFDVQLLGILFALLLVPALFVVWSGVGFPLTLVAIGVQFLAGMGIVSFCFIGGSPMSLPTWYLMAVVISIAGILSITKSGKFNQFLSWSTVPFASLFMIMLFLVSLAEWYSHLYLPIVLMGALLAVGGILLLSVMVHLVVSKSVLPGGS